jgi:hypothetical protein
MDKLQLMGVPKETPFSGIYGGYFCQLFIFRNASSTIFLLIGDVPAKAIIKRLECLPL